MAVQTAQLWIPGRLPGLNEIILASSKRSGKYSPYAKLKEQWGGTIALLAHAQNFPRLVGRHDFYYEFLEPNMRRDPSNFIAGGVKIIEDALQLAGLLDGDGWKNVASIRVTHRAKKEGFGIMLRVFSTWELT